MKACNFLLFIMLILPLNGYGQDTLPPKQIISFGFDLYGPIYHLATPSITNYEGSITMGPFKKIFPTIEAGTLKVNRSGKSDTSFHYNSNGNFIRFGFDYNMFKRKWVKDFYMVYFGCRYGMAQLSHSADHIYIEDNVWGNEGDKYGPLSIPSSAIKAQWIEFTGGIRAEIFKGFSMGWSIRYKTLIHSTGMNLIKPMYIPGYGDGTSSSNWGINYSIYYNFRFQK